MNRKGNNILSDFLVNPAYRIWRHLLFILAGAIITFNQTFIAYQDCAGLLGNRIYWICFSSFLLYLIAIYFNYWFLIPKYLLTGKYAVYSVTLSIIVLLLPISAIVQEYWVRTLLELPHRISSYTNPLILIDSLAAFMITVICFLAVSAVVLFREWANRTKRINEMEYEHLKSEVNKLKGQITPDFLSKTLLNASSLAKENPDKSSEMLMQLGQLLRYQLYDCNRDKVLLKSEINFLENFLHLEQLNNEAFTYNIQTKDLKGNILISPLLFISIIQYMVNGSNTLDVSFHYNDELLCFESQSNNDINWTENDLGLIKKRLDLLYPTKNHLSVKAQSVQLQLNIIE
ncbi:sensor histidine kinase [Bacteroides sp. 224]|uniref:sensor histidine kinase n=1 Tax=Bacteroides sp. 224 TaxID=2302936 RepID=UPI0013CFD7C6|nr:sensor histidine kinase [Bacteroides sp. 224]NDV66314.1 histidine kinase [Bacteroides sp. 224]